MNDDGKPMTWSDTFLRVLKENDVRLVSYAPDNVLGHTGARHRAGERASLYDAGAASHDPYLMQRRRDSIVDE